MPRSMPMTNSVMSSAISQPTPKPQPTPQVQPVKVPESTTATTTTQEKPKQQSSDKQEIVSSTPVEDDYTLMPVELDKKFEALDTDGALRPTIIDIGKVWTKKSQVALLAQPTEQTLSVPEQETERNKAYDLLDALSRSGCLTFDHAALHVVMASTHCFDKTLLNTVVQDNVNPIEKVERSNLIVATTIHEKEARDLIEPSQEERASTYSPLLFPKEEMKLPLLTKEKERAKKSKGKGKEKDKSGI